MKPDCESETSRGSGVAVALLVCLLVAGCERESAAVDPETAVDTPIVIGVSLPLSGKRSDPGTAARRGYETWAARVNETGGLLGRQVELRVLDNASSQEKVVADYEQLIGVDKVDLVLGTQSSFLVIPSSEVAARHGYAYVEPAGGAPHVFDRGLDNLFFAQPGRSSRQADPFAEYLLSLPDAVRPASVAMVVSDDPLAQGVMARLRQLLKQGGMQFVLDVTYPAETTDFSGIAQDVARLDPYVIVGGTQFSGSVGQIVAYREAGYHPRFAFVTSGPSLPGPFRRAVGNASEGIFSSVSWFPNASEHENDRFVAKYVALFGGTIGDIPEDAANAFTVGQVLQQAVEKIGSIDNAALIEELHRGYYKTVVGPLSFQTDGAPQGSYLLPQWQGDNFVIVGPGDRAELDPLPPPKPQW